MDTKIMMSGIDGKTYKFDYESQGRTNIEILEFLISKKFNIIDYNDVTQCINMDNVVCIEIDKPIEEDKA